MSEQRSDPPAFDPALAEQELLRGLQSAVDEVFATMLSTLGLGTRLGDPCVFEVAHGPAQGAGAERDPAAIFFEARIDIRGPLQGWICLSCAAQAADDLARGLLRLGPRELLSRALVEDALGECANMVAGVLKTAMLDTQGCHAISTPRLSSGLKSMDRPRGTLAYRLCAGTLNAELWLDGRPGLP